MKPKIIGLVAILVLVASAAAAFVLDRNKTDDEQKCIKTLAVARVDLYGKDYAEKLYKQDEDVVVSSKVKSNFIPVSIDFNPKLSSNDHLLYSIAGADELFINADYFSDITIADATKLKESAVIGRYKQLSFDEHSAWEVIKFLLESHLVETYWHLKSDICLVEEEDTANAYKAIFDASHDYCTNECLTQDYKFDIEINKKSGEIVISPRE